MVEQGVSQYLNRFRRKKTCDKNCLFLFCRLSDFLFTAARFVALKEGREEVIFRPEK